MKRAGGRADAVRIGKRSVGRTFQDCSRGHRNRSCGAEVTMHKHGDNEVVDGAGANDEEIDTDH